MKIIRYSAAFILFFATVAGAFAHHGGESSGSILLDPSGRSIKSASYFSVIEDISRATPTYSSSYRTTIYGEYALSSMFSLSLFLNHYYYDQKERKDAVRYGKVYAGGKFVPFEIQEGLPFLVFDFRLGFPTGSDTDRFTNENYWDGIVGASAGFNYGRVAVAVRIGGQFPMSRISSRARQSSESLLLKKTTEISGYVSFRVIKSLYLFGGYLYRTPYTGMQVERCDNCDIGPPSIFHEASAGFSFLPSDSWILSYSYRNPVFRDRRYLIYESAVTMSASYFYD